jgi:hypothetical protein
MLIFSISFPYLMKFSYFMDSPGRRFRVKGGPKTGDFTNNFSIYTYVPQNILHGAM